MWGFLRALPEVGSPKIRLSLRDKLKWTGIVLALYFVLGQIPLYGISPTAVDMFGRLRTILAGTFGSVITLGIGPIVTAGLILQLFVGTKIIKIDLTTREGKALYQGLQKFLIILFAVVEAAIFVFRGALPAAVPSFDLQLLLVGQLVAGSLFIMFMDEVVSKWGIGSGVGLFIAAGVSRTILVGSFNPTPVPGTEMPSGRILAFFSSLSMGQPALYLLIPVVGMLITFFISLFGQAMRVEIPIAFGRLRGFGTRWPLRFVYASNIPVILAAALLANFMFIAQAFPNPILGTFTENQPTSGLALFLTPPSMFFWDLFRLASTWTDIARAATYMAFMIGASMIFAVLWVEMGAMGPSDIAEQFRSYELHIPGFRRDPRIMESVLRRYIPSLTILGGAFVGFLAGFADLTGALGGGTGVLLTVGILQNLYEQITARHLEEVHPAVRKFIAR